MPPTPINGTWPLVSFENCARILVDFIKSGLPDWQRYSFFSLSRSFFGESVKLFKLCKLIMHYT